MKSPGDSVSLRRNLPAVCEYPSVRPREAAQGFIAIALPTPEEGEQRAISLAIPDYNRNRSRLAPGLLGTRGNLSDFTLTYAMLGIEGCIL